MNSGSEKGAAGLSVRTEVIQMRRSGALKGSARSKTAWTTENTAMLAPMARASVVTTVNAKAGWRRNCRIAKRIIGISHPTRERDDDLRHSCVKICQHCVSAWLSHRRNQPDE